MIFESQRKLFCASFAIKRLIISIQARDWTKTGPGFILIREKVTISVLVSITFPTLIGVL